MNTEIIIRKIKENKVIAISTAVIILIIIGLLIKTYAIRGSIPNPGPVKVTGVFACLPLQDESAQKTDCKLGIKDSGNYYGIDVSDISLAVTDLKADDKILVSGNFMPADQVTGEEWKKYKIDGLINVDSLTRAK